MRLKILLAVLFVAGLGLVVSGSPVAPPGIERAPRFGGTLPVLPMRFAHADHTGVGCVSCHHEFAERRMDRGCMNCHVTDATVAPRTATVIGPDDVCCSPELCAANRACYEPEE